MQEPFITDWLTKAQGLARLLASCLWAGCMHASSPNYGPQFMNLFTISVLSQFQGLFSGFHKV